MSEMNVLAKLEPKPGLSLSTAPIPNVGRTDVLIKIKKTAICGTDLHIYKWDDWAQKTIPVPMHVGHEFAGEVVEIGADVKRFKVGDRVSGEGHLVCQQCRHCRAGNFHLCGDTSGIGVNRPGAFAEYLVMPAFNTFKIPDSISDEIASIFDPLGNAVHTALSFDLLGEDVLVTGAGPVGIMCAAIARHAGARHVVITDVNPYRLELARQFDVSEAVDMSGCSSSAEMEERLRDTMSRLGMREGFDVTLEASGNPGAINAAVEVSITGGKMVLLGVTGQKEIAIDWDTIVFKSLRLKGIYGREMFETWYKMTAMLESGLNVDKLLTHRLPYTDFEQGFEAMKRGESGKVVLSWE